ncbi:MAG: MMPL family transporter [Clostridiales bacterium]|nr:MMPL family transporter [Clostridiales bacterium]
MKTIAKFIVKWRWIFAVLFIVLAAAGAYFSTQVKQNYDMTKYLPDDTDTKQGLAIMEKEFGLSNNILLMLTVDEGDVNDMKSELSAIEGIQLVTVDSYKDGKALYILTLSGDEYSAQAKETLNRINSFLSSHNYALSGSVVASAGLEQALKVEIPIIMVIAIVIIFLVLLFTSHSWLEPIVFALVLFCAVLINMGSNIIFGEISYITFAVSAILQIALAMDYSIILLHGFTEHKNNGLDKEEALIQALADNMRPISSSGLTTIAGLIALLFMSFTIGFDIGIVLAKGILVSLLSVILFMPSLIMIFSKALEKTAHKPLPLGGGGIAKVSISLRSVLPIIMVLVIAGSYILQMSNVYTFTGWETSNGGEVIAENFGNVNQAVVIIDNEYADDYEAQSGFVNSIADLRNDDGNPAFKSINAWTTLELDPDALVSGLNFDIDKYKPVIEAVLGGSTVGDVQKLWESCGGDIYNIEISEQAIAALLGLSVNDRAVSIIYGLLKEDDKATVGSIVGKFDTIINNPMLGLTDKVPEGLVQTITFMNENRDEVSNAANLILTPLIDKMVEEYGEDTVIYDIGLDMGSIIKPICKILFGGDTFKVYEFYNMWNEAGGDITNIAITESMIVNAIGVSIPEPLIKVFLSMISSDGRITVGKFINFVSDHKDNELIKRILGEEVAGAISFVYMMQEFFVPSINEKISETLTTLRSTFVGEEHSRIILLMDLPKDDDTTFGVIDAVKTYANNYFGEDNYVAGESMTIKDISGAFSDDLLKINLVTIISIFIIIAVLFRSITLPVILVLVIQGAIWITMAIYSLLGIPIFFMSYIICICIQMGATIDYGILIASNYRRNRKTMPKYAAISQSVKSAMPTILTSGLILIAAGFIIGFVSTVMPIYSIGKLLGLGTIISVLLILFLLPAVLYIFDKIISFTTWDGIKPLKTQKTAEGMTAEICDEQNLNNLNE